MTSRHYPRIQTEHKWTYIPPDGQLSRWWAVTNLNGIPDLEYAVADLQRSRLILFDSEGHRRSEISGPAGGWKPFAVAQGAGYMLAATDWTNCCIQLTAPSGQNWKKLGGGVLQRPGDIAMSSVGNWIVSDMGRRSVFVMDPFGGVIEEFKYQTPYRNTWFPEYLATDSRQRIVVSDFNSATVDIFDPYGRHLRSLTGTVITKPNGVAFDSKDNILVCDQAQHRVALFDKDGRFIQDVVHQSRLPDVRGPLSPDFWRPVTVAYSRQTGDLALTATYAEFFSLQTFSYDQQDY